MSKIDKPEDSRGCGGGDSGKGSDTAAAPFITEPLASDLLCGVPPNSGRVPSCHEANLRLRTTLQRWVKPYCAASSCRNSARQDKIVQSLFDSLVQSDGLRFLRPVEIGSDEAIELGVPPEITAAWVPMSQTMVRDLIQKQLGKNVNSSISGSTFNSTVASGGQRPVPDFQPSAQALFRERHPLDTAVLDFHPSASLPQEATQWSSQGQQKQQQHANHTLNVASPSLSHREQNAKEGRTLYNGDLPPASRSVLQGSSSKSSSIRRPEAAVGAVDPAREAGGLCEDSGMGDEMDLGQLQSNRQPKHGHVSTKRSLDAMENANGTTGGIVHRRHDESQNGKGPQLVLFRFQPGKRPGERPSPRLRLVDDADVDYTIYSTILHGSKVDNFPFRFKTFALPRGLDRLFSGYKSCIMVYSVPRGTRGDKAGIAVGDILCWVGSSSSSSSGCAVKAVASPRLPTPSGGRDATRLLTYYEFQRHLDGWHDDKDCLVYIARMQRDICDGWVNNNEPPALERCVTDDSAHTATKVSAAPAPAVARRNESDDTIATTSQSGTKERPMHKVEPQIYATLTNTLVSENSAVRRQCQDLINEIQTLQSKQQAVEQSSDELLRLLQDPSNALEPDLDGHDGSTRANVSRMRLPDVIPTPLLHVNVWDGIGRYIEKMMQQTAELEQQSTTLARDKEVREASLAKATSDRDSLQQEYQQLQAQRAKVLERFKRRRTSRD